MKATKHRPECGTWEGFAAHRRAGEEPCLDCRKAGREHLMTASTAPLSASLARLARSGRLDVPELRGVALDPPRRAPRRSR